MAAIVNINGQIVAVDSIAFLPHNVVSVDILPEYPMTIAVLAKDNADPKTGLEYGNQIGDGGFILKFADGTVTDGSWKAKCFFRGPLNGDVKNPRVEHTPIPENWFAVNFDDNVTLAKKKVSDTWFNFAPGISLESDRQNSFSANYAWNQFSSRRSGGVCRTSSR